MDSLDKLLDLYNQYTNIITDQIKQYFVSNEEKIKDEIIRFLEGCDVYNSSTWEDAEVDDDSLFVTDLGNINPSIIYINDEECLVNFDIDVEFEVTVTGSDFNRANRQ